MNSAGLLKEYGIFTKEKINEKYYTNVNSDAYFMFQITRKGQYFFLWACGVANVEWRSAKDKCKLFPEALHLHRPMFCENIISEGDIYASIDSE